MNRYDNQLENLKSRMRAKRLCVCPDRDVPALLCGHPLPCPYHTIIVKDEDLEAFIEELVKAESKKGSAPLTSGNAPRCPLPRGKDEDPC